LRQIAYVSIPDRVLGFFRQGIVHAEQVKRLSFNP